MKRVRTLFSILTVIVFTLTFSAVAELRVGVSSTTINPAKGTLLGGYGQMRACTGVHDDLSAKAIVFDDGKTPMALIVLDSLGLQYDTVQVLRKRASVKTKALSIPPERIVVASTHTHCSPDVIGIYGPDPGTSGRDADYMEMLVEKSAAQVAIAAAQLQSATLVHTQAEGGEWAVNDCEPGVVERMATVVQCLDKQGVSIATLTNFACHPTVLDGDNTLASADWVGAFYKDMAAALPGEHMFLQGGVGGWVQPKTPERTFALAEEYGKDMAARMLKALKSTQPVQGDTIRFANKVFLMPNANEGFKQLSEGGIIPRPMGDGIETEVVWFAVGNAQFATHPGESAPAFTWATQKLMDTEPKLVLGLGLDELGYLLKPVYFENTESIPHAKYLVSTSPGPEAGTSMMTALESIIP
jgi:hypothetical protein